MELSFKVCMHVQCVCMCEKREKEKKRDKLKTNGFASGVSYLNGFANGISHLLLRADFITLAKEHISIFLPSENKNSFPQKIAIFLPTKTGSFKRLVFYCHTLGWGCGEVQVGSSRQRPGILLNRLQCTGRSLLQNYLSPSVNSATSVKC